MYFKVIMEGGHVGAGKSFDIVRYFESENAFTLLKYLEHYPAMKSKEFGVGVKLIKAIEREEYDEGRSSEEIDLYGKREYLRFDVAELCHLEPAGGEGGDFSGFEAMAKNYSKGGICISHSGGRCEPQTSWILTVHALGIEKRRVLAEWTRQDEDGGFLTGLRWAVEEDEKAG